MRAAILLFRQDLRIEDNPAWNRIAEEKRAIIPLYIESPEGAGEWAPGAAGRWWLHHALLDLSRALKEKGLKLILRMGSPMEVLDQLLEETQAGAVYWNRCYEPHRLRRDAEIRKHLERRGIQVWSGNSALLREPWSIRNQEGRPYRVFTSYFKACLQTMDAEPVVSPVCPLPPPDWPRSNSILELGLLPGLDWPDGLARNWSPGRRDALARLEAFRSGPIQNYSTDRDFPGIDGVSRLSPYLHWGQLGPREVANAITGIEGAGKEVYYKELFWREFAHHVLYHFPDTLDKPLQPKFARFPWKDEPGLFHAWKSGRTGYPLVDAGMRELWETGWMHNRTRMVVASFLVKHLLHSWKEGALWFWDTLVDADLANNTLGWQWAAGCGADAAPYFRIFNPITQGLKFDPEGLYTRKHVPELSGVPDKYLHRPWEMSVDQQKACGCRLGQDYPFPIVDHSKARAAALEAFATIKESL